jgi:hypothetical protein
MDGACCAYEIYEMLIKFLLESLKEKDHSEDLGVGERIILECILKKIWWKCVDCIQLSQDKVQWRDLVNTVMNPCSTKDG